jgi:hypothetical protein
LTDVDTGSFGSDETDKTGPLLKAKKISYKCDEEMPLGLITVLIGDISLNDKGAGG